MCFLLNYIALGNSVQVAYNNNHH